MAITRDDLQHTINVNDANVAHAASVDPTLQPEIARDAGVFVELLDKHDQVLRRVRFETLPITLGNHYRGDFVIDSDANTEQSVVLARNAEGALEVSAARAFWAPGGNTDRWVVDPDRAIVVAGERLRFRTREYVAAKRAPMPDAIRRLSGWTVLFAIAAMLALTAFQAWLVDIEQSRPAQYITGALIMVGALSVWAGLWGVVSKLTGKSTHFIAHLSLAALGSVAMFLFEFGYDTLAYAFDLKFIAQYAYVIAAVLAGALVYAHARWIVRTRVASALIAGFVFASAIGVMQATGYFNARGTLAAASTLNDVRPPGWRVVDGVSLDAFATKVERLKEATEAAKSEKPEGVDNSQYGD